MKKIINLTVEGMNCKSCISKIKDSLEELDCSFESSFNLDQKTISITFSPEDANNLDFKNKIEEVGYRVTKIGSV
jgi:copper chaperone CopZ